MYNVYFFGWDGDCFDEWLDHKGIGSKVLSEAREALKLNDHLSYAIIIELETQGAIQVTKKWKLVDSIPDKDVVDCLMEN